ncbi:MbtH family protein [Kitasatospora sp. NPDC088391]|uniref:MbtH family protein n=1 Tax=Kitasatospora sp. NPDC088391 TaxID=3364074 RepID=UPI0038120C50
MSNPFDDESGRFLVLVNAEAQYSLWPAHLDVPGGWERTGPEGSRQECLDVVERLWTDMRPASLVAAMATGTGPAADAG